MFNARTLLTTISISIESFGILEAKTIYQATLTVTCSTKITHLKKVI